MLTANHSARSVDVNGAALHYEEQGEGAPLILIRGGLASGASARAICGPLVALRLRVTPQAAVVGALVGIELFDRVA
jgi:hypothetical protein